jgi:hypothetical protein
MSQVFLGDRRNHQFQMLSHNLIKVQIIVNSFPNKRRRRRWRPYYFPIWETLMADLYCSAQQAIKSYRQN